MLSRPIICSEKKGHSVEHGKAEVTIEANDTKAAESVNRVTRSAEEAAVGVAASAARKYLDTFAEYKRLLEKANILRQSVSEDPKEEKPFTIMKDNELMGLLLNKGGGMQISNRAVLLLAEHYEQLAEELRQQLVQEARE
jgi:hypothetical protein